MPKKLEKRAVPCTFRNGVHTVNVKIVEVEEDVDEDEESAEVRHDLQTLVRAYPCSLSPLSCFLPLLPTTRSIMTHEPTATAGRSPPPR